MASVQAERRNRIAELLAQPGTGIVLFLLLCAIFMPSVNAFFLTPQNLLFNVLNQSVFVIIIAMAMTVVLIGGGIDLSVGGIVGITAGAAAWLIGDAGLPLWVGLGGGIALGVVIGFFNALVILRLRIPDFIATLAMMGLLSGLLFVWTNGVPFIGYTDDTYRVLGGLMQLGYYVTVPEIIAVAIALLLIVLMTQSQFGVHLRAVGNNAEVAHLSGIKVARMKYTIYMVSGLLAGVVGVLIAGRLTTVQPNLGMGMELKALAAAILGGAALSGGRGSIVGAVLGAITLSVIQNVINLSGVQSAWELFVVGFIILLVASADRQFNAMRPV